MMWWNISGIIQALKDNKITSALQKNYVLLAFLLLALFPLMQMGSLIEALVVGILVVFGVNLVYALNLKGDGKDFAIRFLALTSPIALRIILLRILVVVIEIAMITSTMLAPFPYKRIRGVPLKYAVKFLVSLPAKIMNVIYNPPLEMGTTWFVFHRLIPLGLLVLFFVWMAFAIYKVSGKKTAKSA